SAAGGPLTALYQAGGLTERSNFRAVEVRRGNELLATVDLYDYLLKGIVPAVPPMQTGDVVFVPIRGPRVRIGGEVNRPAIYEIKPGETLRDLVRMAGGLTPLAGANNVTISRIVPQSERTQPGQNRTVVTASLATIMDSGTPSVPLF